MTLMQLLDLATWLLLLAGCAFFLAGTVGMLRFPDARSRLHALTKADNLGLGLIVAGLCLQAAGPAVIAKLIVIWLIALVSSTTAAFLIARAGGGEDGTGAGG
jgi:multicomponent Na+:H+ antiporter subunit G